MLGIFSRLVNRRAVYMVALGADEPPQRPPQRDGVEVRAAAWENINDVKQLRGDGVAQTMRQLLVDDAVGVYAYLEGQFVGHFWAVHSGAAVRRMWGGVDFGPDEVLLCWGWVGNDFRGRGVFQAMISSLVAAARAKHGDIPVVADVPVDPVASLVAHHRMGFHLTGRLEYVRVVGQLVSQRRLELSDDDLSGILADAAPQ